MAEEETLEDIERKIRELEARSGKAPPQGQYSSGYGPSQSSFDILSSFNPSNDPLLSQTEKIMKLGLAKEAIKSQSAPPTPPVDPEEVKHRRRLEHRQAELDMLREQRSLQNEAFQEEMKKMEMSRMTRQDEFQQTLAKMAEERNAREEEWRRRREERDDKYLEALSQNQNKDKESPNEKRLMEELERLRKEREEEKRERKERRREMRFLKKIEEMRNELSDRVDDLESGGEGTMDDYLQKKIELEEYEKKLESVGIRVRKGGLSQLAEGETGAAKYVAIGIDSVEDLLERPVVKRWGDRILGQVNGEEEIDDKDIEKQVKKRKQLRKMDEKNREIHRTRRKLINLGVNPDMLMTATDLMIESWCKENGANDTTKEQIYIARTTLRDGKRYTQPLDDNGKPITTMTNEYLARGLDDLDDEDLDEDLEEELEEEDEEELEEEELEKEYIDEEEEEGEEEEIDDDLEEELDDDEDLGE